MQIDRFGTRARHCSSFIWLTSAILLTGCVGGTTGENPLGDLPVWTLEESLRIGHLDDPDLGFSSIGAVRVSGDGRIFALESQERQIRVFDPEGRRLLTLGGQGEGPGEFQFPSTMGILGDTLWVKDMMSRRITLFSLAGELLGTVQGTTVPFEIGDPPAHLVASPESPRADGTFAGGYSVMIDPDAGRDARTVRVPRLRFDVGGGEILDTVGWYQHALPSPVLLSVGDRLMFVGRPLSDTPLQVGREGARWIVQRPVAPSADEAILTIMSTAEDDADTLFVRTFPYRPIAIDAAFADSLHESLIERFVDDGFPEPDARRTVRRDVPIPDFLPPVTSGLLGEDGSLWLRREEDRAEDWRWNVFDADGEPIGMLRTPRSFEIQVADHDRVWGVHTDDFGVPWVVGYRVRRGASGPNRNPDVTAVSAMAQVRQRS